MKANHVPRAERLRNRIRFLSYRRDENHVPSPTKGNPYWCCKECGIHDPELSIRNGKHFGNCQVSGLQKQIDYYKRLLAEEVSSGHGQTSKPF